MARTAPTLTDRQQCFVEHYTVLGNAKLAAVQAGYSPKTAEKIGWQQLENPRVAAAIQEAHRRRARRLDISAERVLQEYARIGFADPRKVMSWGPDGIRLVDSEELDDDAAACIAEVSETFVKSYVDDDDVRHETLKLTVKFHPKIQALDALSKHLQLFKDGDTNVTNVNVFVASARERLEGRIAGIAARLGEVGLLGEPEPGGGSGA